MSLHEVWDMRYGVWGMEYGILMYYGDHLFLFLQARGIDVQQVSLVINYDLPANRENYIHR